MVRAARNGMHEIGAIELPTTLPQALVVTTAASEFWFEARGLPTPSFTGASEQLPGVAVVAGPANGATTSPYPRENLLLPNPDGRGRFAYAAGESFVRSGIFRVGVARHARDSATLAFEWLDRLALGRPRVEARPLRRGRARVSWAPAPEQGSGDAASGAREVSPRRIVIGIAAAAVAVAAGLVSSGAAAPSHPCVQKDELWFQAADGTRLVGHRFGGRRPGPRTAVVLAHMSEGDLCVWVPYARRLAAKGFFVFPLDFRGHGFSEGQESFGEAPADIAAAVRAVRRLGARKVVIGGASLGGIAALIAAPKIRPPIQGLVSFSGPAAIAGELNARPAVARLRVPTLYVVAAQDRGGPYDFAAEARALYEATATTEKRIEVVPGALHATFLVDRSARVRALLERFLRDPAGSVP